ncbi:hypothetical protein [Bacillus thuringiensis]
MKDVFSLSRGIRRQVGEQEFKGLQSIRSDENLIILEILAIYQ